MIIHDIGKVIGRIAVGLNQHHIVKFGIIHGNIPVNLVMEGGFPFCRVILADNIGNSRSKVGFNLFFGQVKAVFIVSHNHLAVHLAF